MDTREKILYGVCIIINLLVYPAFFDVDFIVIFLICLVPGFAPLMLFLIPIIWIGGNIIG